MRGTVLADADAVVCKDVSYGNIHNSAHSHRAAHIVGESEKRRADGAKSAVELNTVADCRHCVFADTEADITALSRIGREKSFAFEFGFGGGGKIGRTDH